MKIKLHRKKQLVKIIFWHNFVMHFMQLKRHVIKKGREGVNKLDSKEEMIKKIFKRVKQTEINKKRRKTQNLITTQINLTLIQINKHQIKRKML